MVLIILLFRLTILGALISFHDSGCAEASADKILTDVAIGLGHVAAGISTLKATSCVLC